MKKLSSLLIVLLLSACAPNNKNRHYLQNSAGSEGIIDGTEVQNRNTRASRSVVGMHILDANGMRISFCTATLVAPDAIVTAAHCFDKAYMKTAATYQVFFDEDVFTEGKPITIKNHASNPMYNSETVPFDGKQLPLLDHDVAVAILDASAPAPFVPARIDTNTTADYSNEAVVVFGFGRSRDYSGQVGEDAWNTTGFLHTATMHVDGGFMQLPDRYLLAQDPKNDLCQGDSGGPNFMTIKGQLTLVGVNSGENGTILSNGDRACNGQGQATKVAPFASWINATLSQLRSGRNPPKK